jgi:hypothetical protein
MLKRRSTFASSLHRFNTSSIVPMQVTADFFQQTSKILTFAELTGAISRTSSHLSFRAESRNL